jgi:cytochrome c6
MRSRSKCVERRKPLTVATLVAALAWTASPAWANDAALGKEVFLSIAQPSCSTCHVLKDAGAAGQVGPSLDDLDPDAERVAAAVRAGVGAMPPYADTLTSEQIEAVAAYVAGATR